MKINVSILVVVLAVAAAAAPPNDAHASGPECVHLNRSNIVSCALSRSLTVRAEEFGLEGVDGRKRAASVLLPSNPAIGLGVGYTVDPSLRPSDREVVWSASVSQELEIAGQRGRRMELASAERRGQEAKLLAARREAVAAAYFAYFDALAANEERRIADRLAVLSDALGKVSRARAEAGLGSDVEAQLAEATGTRLVQSRIGAEQRAATTSATLAVAVGIPLAAPRPDADGPLAPLSVGTEPPSEIVRTALSRRAEIGVALAEKDASERRAALYERLRIPNPTLSASLRNDWIGERTFGVGLAFPLPLPGLLGRTYAGEIQESNALARRAESEAERVRRSVELEVTTALGAVDSWKRQANLYSDEKVHQTEETLRLLAQEVEARRLSVREALLTQQALIDYLFAAVEAKRRLCFASVELARATGGLLDGGRR